VSGFFGRLGDAMALVRFALVVDRVRKLAETRRAP
jgi:hypothetical protein